MFYCTEKISYLSIIRSGNFSGRNVFFYVIASIVVFCIFIVLKNIVKSATSYKPTNKAQKVTQSTLTNTQIVLNEEYFDLVHEHIVDFLQAYSNELPNEWYHYFISQEFEQTGENTIEGYLKFQILLGTWWDCLLQSSPALKEFIISNFSFDPIEKTFTYKIQTGTSTGKAYPKNKVTNMVHTYLNNYEAKHTCIHLKQTDFGAVYNSL